MAEIAATSEQQNAGIDQVHRAVARLKQVTRENADLVEESRRTADAMRGQAAGLVEVVGVFDMDGPAAAQPAAGPQEPRGVPVAHALPVLQ
jgi:methyl-accepting chemotaxis protein